MWDTTVNLWYSRALCFCCQCVWIEENQSFPFCHRERAGCNSCRFCSEWQWQQVTKREVVHIIRSERCIASLRSYRLAAIHSKEGSCAPVWWVKVVNQQEVSKSIRPFALLVLQKVLLRTSLLLQLGSVQLSSMHTLHNIAVSVYVCMECIAIHVCCLSRKSRSSKCKQQHCNAHKTLR